MIRSKLSKMRGAGDLVEAVTTATGVKAVVEKVSKATGKDCGCKKRKELLNKAMPFGGADELQPKQD